MSWNMLKGSNGTQQAWYSQRRQINKGLLMLQPCALKGNYSSDPAALYYQSLTRNEASLRTSEMLLINNANKVEM